MKSFRRPSVLIEGAVIQKRHSEIFLHYQCLISGGGSVAEWLECQI